MPIHKSADEEDKTISTILPVKQIDLIVHAWFLNPRGLIVLTFHDTRLTDGARSGKAKTVVKPHVPRPLISSSVTTGLLDAIAATGADPDLVRQSMALDFTALSDAEGFIACVDFARLLEEVAQATGDRCFGLHFGARSNPKNIGPLVYAVLNSPTIAVACQTAARDLHVHNQALKLSLDMADELAKFTYSYAHIGVEKPRQFSEFTMAGTLNTFRIMAGSQWSPREIQFAHDPPESNTEHLRVFRAPVTFRCASNALIMEREFLDQTVPSADHRLFGILTHYLGEVLNRMPTENGVIATIRKAIGESLKGGTPKLARVAKSIALSPRTLQRRLEKHGLDFKQLVDDTRHQFALEYLRDQENTLTQIAFLLGYSEVSAFNRAFKRWTGSPPQHYRSASEVVPKQ
ncbi:MAG: AraC family transcriptional regulator [Candidatus Binatia bacterium]